MHSAHASAVADVPRRWAHANTEITVRVGYLTRVATLHVPLPRQPPTAQAPAPALPLVLNWHGMMEDPVEEEGLTDMDRVADEHQFVVAYPKGIARAQIAKSTLPGFTHNGGGCCSSANTDGVAIDDVQFAIALVDAVASMMPINRSRVFSTGFSNGAFMSHRLACQASHVFAAVAAVSGVLANKANLAMGSTQKFDCKPGRSVPVLQIHGTKDELVWYKGNFAFGWDSVQASTNGWVARNNCSSIGSKVSFQNRSASSNESVTCTSFCSVTDNVTLCTINGGHHSWPGGRCGGALGSCSVTIPNIGKINFVGEPIIHTADEIWRFFRYRSLPNASASQASIASARA